MLGSCIAGWVEGTASIARWVERTTSILVRPLSSCNSKSINWDNSSIRKSFHAGYMLGSCIAGWVEGTASIARWVERTTSILVRPLSSCNSRCISWDNSSIRKSFHAGYMLGSCIAGWVEGTASISRWVDRTTSILVSPLSSCNSRSVSWDNSSIMKSFHAGYMLGLLGGRGSITVWVDRTTSIGGWSDRTTCHLVSPLGSCYRRSIGRDHSPIRKGLQVGNMLGCRGRISGWIEKTTNIARWSDRTTSHLVSPLSSRYSRSISRNHSPISECLHMSGWIDGTTSIEVSQFSSCDSRSVVDSTASIVDIQLGNPSSRRVSRDTQINSTTSIIVSLLG